MLDVRIAKIPYLLKKHVIWRNYGIYYISDLYWNDEFSFINDI